MHRIRTTRTDLSLTKLAYEYDMSKGTISNVENGNGLCKIATVWKMSNAMGVKFSEIVTIVEDELGENFTLIDE